MLGQREYVILDISIIWYNTTNLAPISVCLPFGASGFKFGSWVDIVINIDNKILCQIVMYPWEKKHMGSA